MYIFLGILVHTFLWDKCLGVCVSSICRGDIKVFVPIYSQTAVYKNTYCSMYCQLILFFTSSYFLLIVLLLLIALGVCSGVSCDLKQLFFYLPSGAEHLYAFIGHLNFDFCEQSVHIACPFFYWVSVIFLLIFGVLYIYALVYQMLNKTYLPYILTIVFAI